MDDLIRRQVLLAEKFARLECALQANKDAHFDVYKRGWNEALQTVYDNAPSAQQWIPCSERLPEEEGWYLVTIQNDKTRKRRTENDLFAIGIAEAHKHTPYKFCKDGHRQTVIAWMPIPEPYKAESEEV